MNPLKRETPNLHKRKIVVLFTKCTCNKITIFIGEFKIYKPKKIPKFTIIGYRYNKYF